jgi:hypothetical protein
VAPPSLTATSALPAHACLHCLLKCFRAAQPTQLQEKTDWDSAKRVLGDATFIDRLIAYDKDNITERIRRELRQVVADPAFTPDQVRLSSLL